MKVRSNLKSMFSSKYERNVLKIEGGILFYENDKFTRFHDCKANVTIQPYKRL